MSFLKYLRVAIAIALFLPITLFFIDFLGWLPMQVHGLLHLQLIPAAMKLNVGVLVFLLILTLLFGRIYCSAICPLGVMQDIIFRLSKPILKEKHKSRKKKQEKLREYRERPLLGRFQIFLLFRNFYARPNNWLRYSLFAISLVAFVFAATGIGIILDIFDPYSNFGRIASNLFRPLAILVNNGVAEVLNGMGSYSVFKVKITTIEWITFAFSSFVLLLVFILSFSRGRLYCNTICPVGTFLGVLSRLSFFKIRIDKENCTSCGKCEFKCKSQCIDSERMTVDSDRCVACFNCISRCKNKSITFSFALPAVASQKNGEKETKKGRRAFLAMTGMLVSAVATAKHGKRQGECGERHDYHSREPIMPPGAVNRIRFLEKCTACQLCVTKCPSHVLKPALTEYGWEGVMHPRMDFSNGFCNYDCTDCCSVCPNDALVSLTTEEKRLTQVGVVHFVRKHCVVITDETSCGACSEHCPTQAVHMVEYKEGLTIPEINPDICIGCGGCESICPVRPAPAIFITGNREQIQAEKPKEEEAFDKKIDDFGF